MHLSLCICANAVSSCIEGLHIETVDLLKGRRKCWTWDGKIVWLLQTQSVHHTAICEICREKFPSDKKQSLTSNKSCKWVNFVIATTLWYSLLLHVSVTGSLPLQQASMCSVLGKCCTKWKHYHKWKQLNESPSGSRTMVYVFRGLCYVLSSTRFSPRSAIICSVHGGSWRRDWPAQRKPPFVSYDSQLYDVCALSASWHGIYYCTPWTLRRRHRPSDGRKSFTDESC